MLHRLLASLPMLLVWKSDFLPEQAPTALKCLQSLTQFLWVSFHYLRCDYQIRLQRAEWFADHFLVILVYNLNLLWSGSHGNLPQGRHWSFKNRRIGKEIINGHGSF